MTTRPHRAWMIVYFGQCFENYVGTEAAPYLGASFSRLRLCANFDENGLDYIFGDFFLHFGRFFHKRIWSPWS
jgi:hypothetical protein